MGVGQGSSWEEKAWDRMVGKGGIVRRLGSLPQVLAGAYGDSQLVGWSKDKPLLDPNEKSLSACDIHIV